MQTFKRFVALAGFAATLLAAGVAQAKDATFKVSEGTNFAVTTSPDGATLALDVQGRVWVLPAKGGEAKPITPVMDEARYPVWSPDGQWLAFQFYVDENWQVAVVRKDGSGLRQVTFGAVDNREPAWRADGKAVVFSSDRERSLDIWETPIDHDAARPLTSGAADDYYPSVSPDGSKVVFIRSAAGANSLVVLEEGKPRTLVSGPGQLGRPQWSPDGKSISLSVYDDGRGDSRIDIVDATSGKVLHSHEGKEDIFPTGAAWRGTDRVVYAADGGIRTWSLATDAVSKTPFQVAFTVMDHPQFAKRPYDFTSTHERPLLGILRPMVSPDGKQIAFTALGNIWLLTTGNPKPVQLTHDAYLNVDPTWSRDGRQLAYVSDRRGTGTMDLYVRDMATGAEHRLTQTEEDLLQPSWSPDDKTIAVFMRDAADWHAATLYLADAATGAMKKAHSKLFLPSVPSWSADGRKISVLSLRIWSDRFRKGDNAFFTIDLASGEGHYTTPDTSRSVSTRSQFGPIWSPDGTRMAYIHDGLLWSVAVDADGEFLEPPLQLSRDYAAYPSWTGDSKGMVFLAGTHLKHVFLDDGHIDDIPLQMTWSRPAASQRLVVQAGRVFTGVSPTYLRDVDIVVDDNVITGIVPRQASWPGAKVIDARDKAVVPGLFQTHIHQFDSDGEKLGRIWLSFGITSVREPGAEPYEALERREAWMSGTRPGPREFYANILEGNRVFYWMNATVVANSQLEMELQRAVDLDYDFIKTYETMDHEIQKRIVEFAHAHGLMVASHELYPATVFGADAVEHLGTKDRMEFSDRISIKRRAYDDVIQLMSRSGIYINPTSAGRSPQISYMTQIERHPDILSLPQVEAFDPRYKKAHEGMMVALHKMYGDRGPARTQDELESLAKMYKAGITIGSGTDGGTLQDGYSVILEMIHFADAFGAYPALQTGTINAAKITGVDRYLGSLETGKLADMLIVDGDPLKNVADLYKLKTVIKDGRPYDVPDLLKRPK